MKNIFIFLFICNGILAQDEIHNFGSLKLHTNGTLGIHSDLVNEGSFEQNTGLVGFYGYNKSIAISGNTMLFFDTEVFVDDGLYLDTGIGVLNNSNLIKGDLITPRTQTNIYTEFFENAFYNGENDESLVDGYAALAYKKEFTFPVGDDNRIRPLTITSKEYNSHAKCAYFYENPNSPSTMGKSFTTFQKTPNLTISQKEFWHLNGNVPSLITLNWDKLSEVSEFANRQQDITVVGWHKEMQEWQNLGNRTSTGDLTQGTITSDSIVPINYEIITLGGFDSIGDQFEVTNLGNYLVTPNNDNKNDYLILDGIENSPNNELQIYNRYGALVYKKVNYKNEFNGFANTSGVLNKNKGLPSGVYFYIITFLDSRQKHQGFLYLSTQEMN